MPLMISEISRSPGARFSKVPRTFRARKPFVKLRPAHSVKLVFSYVVKGIKIKITAKFRASRRLHFEDTKRIMSPDLRPKSFGTFEKQAPAVVRSLFSTILYWDLKRRIYFTNADAEYLFVQQKNLSRRDLMRETFESGWLRSLI